MLTPKQAESVATALAMRPETRRDDLLVCPACDSTCVSPAVRRRIGFIQGTPCPHCGALLHLKSVRSWLAAYLIFLTVVGVVAYLAWPAGRHVVQTFAGPFWVLMIVAFSATLQRLPLTAE